MTLPKMVRTGNTQTFKLAKALKGFSDLNTDPPPVDRIEEIVFRWHALAVKEAMTKNTIETTLHEFWRAWESVKQPGDGLAAVWDESEHTDPPPAIAHRTSMTALIRVGRFVRLLHQRNAGAPFYVSYRTLSGLLGAESHNTGGHVLKLLIRYGVLKVVQQGGTAERKRLASVYQYIGD